MAGSRSRQPSPHAPGQDASSPATFSLVVCTPDGTVTLALDSRRTYRLGKGRTADIRLDYPWVSDTHAVIMGGDPPELLALEPDSTITVSDQHVPTGSRVPLAHQSVIAIGTLSILVHRVTPRGGSVSTRTSKGDSSASDRPPSTRPPSTRPRSHRRAAHVEGLVTVDPMMRELVDLLSSVAATDVSVLIMGETGVGKELLARAVHANSSRKHAPLVTLNCATIPENLVESELFGHERGAFSGALAAKPGLFEVADGGTLLLDELGELPKLLQPKLLRALETGEVMRIGAVRPSHVDVRIVSATNRNILSEIASGGFRSDLYYRLNGITLVVPPLRDRPADIPALAEHFASGAAHGPDSFSPEAMAALVQHGWPGNVRELKSVVERALLLSGGGPIQRSHVVLDAPVDAPQPPRSKPPSQPPLSTRPPRGKAGSEPASFPLQERPTSVVAAEFKAELARREQRRIREALARAGGNQKDAAKLLGISRRTLINRIERYGIERPRKRSDEP